MLEQQLETLLEAFMCRLDVRPGNGLTRSMNQSLRSYPRIPEIIRRTVKCLARTEQTFQFSGTAVRTWHLYWHLVQEHDDYGTDVPVIRKLSPQCVRDIADHLGEAGVEQMDLPDHPSFAGTVQFVRQRKLSWNEFAAAMAIARRIGLVGGHGVLVLDSDIRKALKRLTGVAESTDR